MIPEQNYDVFHFGDYFFVMKRGVVLKIVWYEELDHTKFTLEDMR